MKRNNAYEQLTLGEDVENMTLEIATDTTENDETQIETIRRLSNVIQALENLHTQCEDFGPFAHIQDFAQNALMYSHLELRRYIHQ